MSTTHDALIGSLLRCALAVIGSHLPSDLYSKMDTVATNVAARKILGVDRTARKETLHFVAGAQTYRNLAAIHPADDIDLSLSANNSSIKDRVEAVLRTKYNTHTWKGV